MKFISIKAKSLIMLCALAVLSPIASLYGAHSEQSMDQTSLSAISSPTQDDLDIDCSREL